MHAQDCASQCRQGSKQGQAFAHAHNEFCRQDALSAVESAIPGVVPWVAGPLCAVVTHVHNGLDGTRTELKTSRGGDQEDAMTSLTSQLCYKTISAAVGSAARAAYGSANETHTRMTSNVFARQNASAVRAKLSARHVLVPACALTLQTQLCHEGGAFLFSFCRLGRASACTQKWWTGTYPSALSSHHP